MTSLYWCHLVTFSRRFVPCVTVLKSLRIQISFWWIRRPKIFFASVLIVWFRQLILLLAPPQQRLRPQLVQLLLQSPLPPRQHHPLFSQTRLRLLYQQPGRNMPVCSAINRQQETLITRISENVPATSKEFRWFSEDFQTFTKNVQGVQMTFKHLRSY